MTFDLHLIPTTYDSVHVALAAIVVGLLMLQLLALLIAWLVLRRNPQTPELRVETAPMSHPAVAPVEVQRVSTVVKETMPEAAVQLLGLLQKEARFIDFIEENISGYSDADIGAAARVVHEGCRKVLQQYFELEPIRREAEGQRITLPKGFDAAAIRLVGNIVGEAPFTGTLVHRGWRVKKVDLPKITEGHDVSIVAAAEVEL